MHIYPTGTLQKQFYTDDGLPVYIYKKTAPKVFISIEKYIDHSEMNLVHYILVYAIKLSPS